MPKSAVDAAKVREFAPHRVLIVVERTAVVHAEVILAAALELASALPTVIAAAPVILPQRRDVVKNIFSHLNKLFGRVFRCR